MRENTVKSVGTAGSPSASHEEVSHTSWRVKLDPTVNLGHILSASVFLFTAGMVWATLDAKHSRSEERIMRLERLEDEFRRERLLEMQRAGAINESISSMRTLLERMDRQINTLLQRRADADGRP
jgi:hypothetical protein